MLRKGAASCVVPLHRELKRGTLSGILRQAGVGAADFIKAFS
jgi:predicted RNA binding protein YcfA (HicA-like mRNA interferase family)